MCPSWYVVGYGLVKKMKKGDYYKKGIFNDAIPRFLEKCKPYYHISKRIYLERKLNYNTFITILRQICKNNNLTYVSKLVYNKSNYNIDLYIFTS